MRILVTLDAPDFINATSAQSVRRDIRMLDVPDLSDDAAEHLPTALRKFATHTRKYRSRRSKLPADVKLTIEKYEVICEELANLIQSIWGDVDGEM